MNTKCPFDGVFCKSKQNYFEEFRMFAFRNPELVTLKTNNLVNGCPIKHELERKELCKRYFKYCLDNIHAQR